MRGRFITFEGGEGAGKSTQVRLLADRLRGQGRTVVLTREPGGSAFADDIRALLLRPARAEGCDLAEALLFNAARADHLAATIRPALARGDWVISDRFMDSTRAYQGSAGKVPFETLTGLEHLVVGDTRPELTLVLDLDPRIGLERARRRHAEGAGEADARDPFEARQLAFHDRLRRGFLAIASGEPKRCVVLDAGDPPEILAQAVWDVVASRLGLA